MLIKICRQKGFTLIEMLMVIAVISVIAAMAIMTYRRHMISLRVEKIALQMQNVLEAAMAYNVDQAGSWPNANPLAPTCLPANPNDVFIQNYLPNANYTSAFGNYFCWSHTTNGSNTPLFWVAVKLPNNNINLGMRIAARLPNAIITSDLTQTTMVPCDGTSNCYVRAEVPQPGASSNESQGDTIAAAGDCKTSAGVNTPLSGTNEATCTYIGGSSPAAFKIDFNGCSGNTQPILTAAPNFIGYPVSAGGYGVYLADINTNIATNSCQDKVCSFTMNADWWDGKQKVSVVGYSNGYIGASYMILCQSNRT